jgi:hypothetical protein
MDKYACRICRSEDYSLILDYGPVALAGELHSSLEEATKEKKYPLSLVFCNSCSHIQIREILDPTILFTDYAWQTGVGTSIIKYCREFAEHVAEKTALQQDGLVLEIASNDGTLLSEFKKYCGSVIGVDPARRISELATSRGIPTRNALFDQAVAEQVAADAGQADLIIGRNVLAHVANLHGLMTGVHTLMKRGGTAVIEFPHLLPMYDELQYDQVYHEHIGYHSLDSMRRLAEMHELRVIDVESVPLHGGSIRCYLAGVNDSRIVSESVTKLLEKEQPLLKPKAWADFGDRVREQKRLLVEELTSARARGEAVVGYGASGKGQSLIQFCGLNTSHVNYIVDKAPIKHGKWTPGSHIPIFDPSHMEAAGLDVLLLFSWNLAEEILKQEQELRDRGVRFLHPIPVPHYL